MNFFKDTNAINLKADHTQKIFLSGAFLCGIALPLSTALVTVGLLLILLGLAINYRTLSFALLAKEPLVYIALILFAVLAISLIWAQADSSTDYLSKYRKLLLILPISLMFLQSPNSFKYFLSGFLWANGIALFFSIYCWVSQHPLGYGLPSDPSVFKKHITHNFFMAIAVIAWLEIAFTHNSIRRKLALIALAIVGMINVWLMVDGRTGQLALICGLAVWTTLTFKKLKLSAAAWSTSALLLLFLIGLILNLDIHQLYINGLEEIRTCQSALKTTVFSEAACNTSMGARFNFFIETLNIAVQHPWGIGVGGFPEPVLNRSNPHNDYFLYLIQLGWAGLAIFFTWTVLASVIAFATSNNERALLASLIIMYAVGNLFNSFTLDFNEGHFYVFLIAYLASKKKSRTTKPHYHEEQKRIGGEKNIVELRGIFSQVWSHETAFTMARQTGGKVVRSIANRETRRFVLDGKGYYCKWHTETGWKEIIKNIIYFRLPIVSATPEWEALNKLKNLNIPCPTPLAYGVSTGTPAKRQSFIVTKEIENLEAIDSMTIREAASGTPLKFKEMHQLVSVIANMAQQIHTAGLNHRDFYLCHFMIDNENLTKLKLGFSPIIFIMDLHRAQIRKKVPLRWLIKDIGGLYYSALDLGIGKRHFFRFLKIYFATNLRTILKRHKFFLQRVEKRAIRTYIRDFGKKPTLPW